MGRHIALKVIHYINNKPVYCDVMTDYGMITIPYEVYIYKIKLGEVIEKDGSEIRSEVHTKGIELYHVSFKETEGNRIYTPRIPKSAANMEDKTIPRICLSDSIEGAISAIPDGVDMISTDSLIDSGTSIENCNTIYIGSITVGNKDSRLINYNKLYESDLVLDALSTHEYWWTSNRLLLNFRGYEVNELENTFHYIIADKDKEALANELGKLSGNEVENELRRLSGAKLYAYINSNLTQHNLLKDKIGNLMFKLDIEDINVVTKIVGQYKSN